MLTLEFEIVRISSTAVRVTVFPSEALGGPVFTEVTGLTLSNTNILKITGTASGASGGSNDITAKMGSVYWYPASN